MSSHSAAPTHRGRIGTVVNGKWRIDERVGSGGMSTVYAATGPGGERVALKMLHTQLGRDADVRGRFLREAYVAQVVTHPGIVKVIGDDVSEDGSVYLVLELLVGETLEALRVGAAGALPVDEILDVADQVLDALDAAHARDIVHRDVKPENVFVTTDGVVKVLDFGLARMRDGRQETTKTGVTIGTPEFMPPEQAGGRKDGVDERSDVWGVGALVFTSITGRYVHEAPTLHETLVAAATERARPLRELAPHVSQHVAEVIDKALELEKHDRWSSARAMQAALRLARGHTTEMIPRPPESSATNVFTHTSERIALDQPVGDDDPTIHRNAPLGPALGAMMAGGATLALPPAAPSSTQAVVAAPAQTERRETRATVQMRDTAPLRVVSREAGYMQDAPFSNVGSTTQRVLGPPPSHMPSPSHVPSPSQVPSPSHAPSPSLGPPPSLGPSPSVVPPSLVAPAPPARTARMLVLVAVVLLLILVAVGAWVMRRQAIRHAAVARDVCGIHAKV